MDGNSCDNEGNQQGHVKWDDNERKRSLPVCLSACLSVCLPVCLSVYFLLCLS